MEFCDTCKTETNHGGYDFCPAEVRSKLETVNAENDKHAMARHTAEAREELAGERIRVLELQNGVMLAVLKEMDSAYNSRHITVAEMASMVADVLGEVTEKRSPRCPLHKPGVTPVDRCIREIGHLPPCSYTEKRVCGCTCHWSNDGRAKTCSCCPTPKEA